MDGRSPADTPASAAKSGQDEDGRDVASDLARDTPTTPVERGTPQLQPYRKAAAGLQGVTTSLGYTVREAGVVRGLRTLLKVNQKDGFDCPSCAWPDPADRSFAEFCENGARAVADEATTKRVTPEFFAHWPISRLLQQSDHWLNKQGRLTHPMLREAGSDHYRPVAWDEAFGLIAHTLRELDHPDRAVFYTSGRTSNEAAFLYQLFVRQFGTNNMPDCSNMCHESSGTGLSEVIGIGKGTVRLDDFPLADAIFVIGQNPGTNHPRMLGALQDAKQRGCTIVTINPLKEAGMVRFKHPQHVREWVGDGTPMTDLFLQVRVGGDVALLKGIMKAMLADEVRRPGQVLDHEFIAQHTRGFETFAQTLRSESWDRIVSASGVARKDIERAAEIAVASQRTIACWAMGITQHKNGVANVQEIVNFLLLRGNIGKPGAGVCPVRGHSNVQGDRTMGIWERPPPWIDRLGEVFEFTPPDATGLDTVGALQAMHAGQATVFFGLGGNFLSATPDTGYAAQALRRCTLTVHVSTKLNRAHLVTGEQALILPCLGRTERDVASTGPQFVTVENSMGVVHMSRGALPPASEHLLSEPQIVARLAAATVGDRSRVPWTELAADYDRIRDAIARVIPGFDDYNQRVRRPSGFELPNPARARRWTTATGTAMFTVHPIPDLELAPGRLRMTTIRAHDQFNTTVYDLDDRYRGVYGHRRVILLNAQDLAELRIRPGDNVTITSHFHDETRSSPSWTVVAYDLPRGCAASYFPEANELVHVDDYADRSRTPASKSVVVTLQRE